MMMMMMVMLMIQWQCWMREWISALQCVSHWLCDGDADDGGGYVNDDYGDHGDDDDDDANDDGDDDDDDQKWPKIIQVCRRQGWRYKPVSLPQPHPLNPCHHLFDHQPRWWIMLLMIVRATTMMMMIITMVVTSSLFEMLTNLFQSWNASIWATISIRKSISIPRYVLQINSWHKPLTEGVGTKK